MGGLRMLCCSKGDTGDDSQDSPVRPALPRPEKTTQNAPTSVKKEASLANMTPTKLTTDELVQEKPIQQTPAQRDLWKEAFDGLDPSQKPYVAANGLSATAAINQVIKDTTAKYEQWQKGGLKIHRKDGNDIDLRGCAEKILGAAMKAGDLISTAVSFDPTGQASTAWMVVSFGMNIVQNRLDRRDAIFAASEYLAETLSYYALIDINYRNQNVGSDHNLDQALLRVYSAILEFTAEVKKGRDENEAKRTFQSVLALTDQPLQTLKDTINSQGAIADKWANLAANLGDRQRAAEHLSKTDTLLAGMKSLASIALTAEEEAQLVWMSEAPYSDRQRALQKKRNSDTGLWLLDLPEYNDWKTVPGSLLWLPGISGCGKSVLCSTIIQDIQEDCSLDPSKFLGYWYFQFGVDATKTADAMARSLIRQLSRSPLAPEVTKIWEEHHLKGSQPDSIAIVSVLDNLLSGITGDVYLVFDALDECPENEESKERGLVLDLLEGLLQRHTKVRMHVLVTSRPEQDIKQRLERFSKIDLESHLAEDVKTFVTSCLAKAPLNRWKSDIHNLIYDELLNSKERRFRWAELQIMALERCRKEDRIKHALKAIPQTLEETYRKVLENIDSNDAQSAREILIIICLSPVILDAQTITDMVGLSFPEALVDICTTSLITLFDEKVQLSHFSVQEFLVVLEENGQHHPCQFSAANGHKYLTGKTVDILLEQTEVLTQASAKKRTPFLYAAKHWNTHMAAAGGIDKLSPEMQAKINRLFTESNVYWNWVRAADSDDQDVDNEWSKLLEECQPQIHRASVLGLAQPVDCLLAQGANPFKSSTLRFGMEIYCNTFVAAANQGHLDILQALLDKGPPMRPHDAAMVLTHMNATKAGKAKLASVLQKLWDLGLLRKRGSDTSNEIDEKLLEYSMRNFYSAPEIMDVFLDWQPMVSVSISDHLLLEAISNSKGVLNLLLERCDVHISPAVLEGSKGSAGRYGWAWPGGHALLAIKRPNEFPVDDDLFGIFAQNLDLEEMKSLMQIRKFDICVTKTVLEMAALNSDSGGVFRLLWPNREPGIVISELMLINAAANDYHSREILSFMQGQIDPRMNLSEETINKLVSTSNEGVIVLKILLSLSSSELPVSERLVGNICSHREATEMLSLLANNSFNVPITEGVMSSAASNRFQGPTVIKYLAKLHQKPLPVAESTVVAAVKNLEQGGEVLAMLLQDTTSILLTDKVFEEACQNESAMALLLDRRRNDLPIDTMISTIADGDRLSRGVLQVLLERNLVKIDESVVEALAINFYTLNALLSWKPDSPITEKALIAGAKDDRSMRVMLEIQGSGVHVTEEVLMTAASSSDPLSVMKVILYRQGSIDVTEKILRVAFKRTRHNLITWLLAQVSESLITKFLLRDTWQDIELWNYVSRCCFLVAFAKKTVSRINYSMSQDLPFDPEEEERTQLKELIMHRRDELSELPATELAALILTQSCYNETIEKFWEDSQFSVTDCLIQAAERNPIADKEKLKSFLEQKRG